MNSILKPQRSHTTAFLLGLPRSGTTLLSALLNQHSEVLCPAEPWLLLALAEFGKVHPAASCGPRLLQDAIRNFFAENELDATLHGWADGVYRQRSAQAGRSVFVDKTPRYYLILDRLQKWFPDAPRIVLLRHPLDVAVSMAKTWKVDLVEVIAQRMDHRLAGDFCWGHACLADLMKDPSKQTVFVRYEELVRDPNAALQPVWAALGVAPQVIDPSQTCDAANPALLGTMGDPNIRRQSEIHSHSVSRWRKEMDLGSASILAQALGREVFEQLGYAHDMQGIKWDGGPSLTGLYRNFAQQRNLQSKNPNDEAMPNERELLLQAITEQKTRIAGLQQEVRLLAVENEKNRGLRFRIKRFLTGNQEIPEELEKRRLPVSILILGVGNSEKNAAACQRAMRLLKGRGSCLLHDATTVDDQRLPGVDVVTWAQLEQRAGAYPDEIFLVIVAGDEVSPGALEWISTSSMSSQEVVIGNAAWGTSRGVVAHSGSFARTLGDIVGARICMRGMAIGGKALCFALGDAASHGQPVGFGWRLLCHLFRRQCRVVDRLLVVLDARVMPTCWPENGWSVAEAEFQQRFTPLGRLRRLPSQLVLTCTSNRVPWPAQDLAEPLRWASMQLADLPRAGSVVGFRRFGTDLEAWLQNKADGFAGVSRFVSVVDTPMDETLPSTHSASGKASHTWISRRLQTACKKGSLSPTRGLLVGVDTYHVSDDCALVSWIRVPVDAGGLSGLEATAQVAAACVIGRVFEETDDCFALLRRVSTFLVPGGRVYLEIANLASTQAQQGFGWHAWRTPSRLRIVSPSAVRSIASQTGFELSALVTHNGDGVIRQDEQGEWQIAELKKV